MAAFISRDLVLSQTSKEKEIPTGGFSPAMPCIPKAPHAGSSIDCIRHLLQQAVEMSVGEKYIFTRSEGLSLGHSVKRSYLCLQVKKDSEFFIFFVI